MIPLERMPGFRGWGAALDALLARPEPIWVFGAPGTGVSTVGTELAHRRGTAFLDEAEAQSAEALHRWITEHPAGILGSHCEPDPSLAIPLRLPDFDEAPEALAPCLEAMAREQGLESPLPTALEALPCPGNLIELGHRLLRWKLLGQLPEPPAGSVQTLPLEDENLARNLHELERLLLHRALRRSYGNRVEAAKRLGVSRRQLYLLIARHGDPVRGERPTAEGPKRLRRGPTGQNSSSPDSIR